MQLHEDRGKADPFLPPVTMHVHHLHGACHVQDAEIGI